MIQEIPVTMSAILGKTTMTIKELLALSQGSVVQLEGMAGAPLQILVNNYPFAKGEVVVVNEHYGIRITEIMTPSERMQKFTK
ncbi:Flagellar motor switch protein FliN [compost metagenome]